MELPKLQRCIRKLSLSSCNDVTILKVLPMLRTKMKHLELCECQRLKEVKISPRHELSLLRKVVIVGCGSLSDVTWLIYAPKLQTLELRDCRKLLVSIALWEDTNIEKMLIFSRLMVLRLVRLPYLCGICNHVLPFPSLRKIEVLECRNLKKLPFDSKSAKNSLIHGDKMWWDSLRWEDETTKQVFSSKFVRHSRDDDVSLYWHSEKSVADVGASSSSAI